jgi:hypothetical protein
VLREYLPISLSLQVVAVHQVMARVVQAATAQARELAVAAVLRNRS